MPRAAASPRRPPLSDDPRKWLPKTSGIVRTLGVIAIVSGNLVGLAYLYQLTDTLDRRAAVVPAPGAPTTASGFDWATIEADARATDSWLAAGECGFVVMSAALVVVGIGLVREREVWRRIALVWSAVALVVLAGHAALWELGAAPHMVAALDCLRQSHVAPELMAPIISAFQARLSMAETMEFAAIGVLMVFPIALLRLLTRQSVKDGMRG